MNINNDITKTLNSIIPIIYPNIDDKPKKRPSSKSQLKRISNKLGNTEITDEQRFRNYLKYIDPELRKKDGIDKEELIEGVSKILSVFQNNSIHTTEKPVLKNNYVEEDKKALEIINSYADKADAVDTIKSYIKTKKASQLYKEKNYLIIGKKQIIS